MAFLPDQTKLISMSNNKIIYCWNTVLGKLTSKIVKEACIIGFSADKIPVGLYWVQSTIDVWNAETGKAITTLRGHFFSVTDAAFSLDFTQLMSGSWDKKVQIWSTATWECIIALAGHNDIVWSVGFLPDGSCVVSGSGDKTVHVWDVATGESLSVIKGHNNWVTSVCFSSNSLSSISRDDNGLKREWKVFINFPPPISPFPRLPTFDLDNSGWLFMTTPSAANHCRLCWLPSKRRGVIWSSG